MEENLEKITDDRFVRTKMLLGDDKVEGLKNCRVAVFGIGGVGGYVCEALARSGVGVFDLVDSDIVDISNINRQIIATENTVGRLKTSVMKDRILEINSGAVVNVHNVFFLPENADDFDFGEYDYVVDAVDTVTAKIAIVEKAVKSATPVISSMGTGNKLNPMAFKVADIYDTRVCPLAKVMRRELRKRGIEHLDVVYSEETPLSPVYVERKQNAGRKKAPGSVAFVPGAAGLLIAGHVVERLINKTGG